MLRLLCLLTLTSHLAAQNGTIPADRPRARPASALTGWADWEKGEELLKRIQVPPAPVLSAEEEAKTFKLAPGYRAELVACEPMVQCPIFFEFDPEGRIWVVEYQGYMRDVQGSGEGDPICRVVVLTDENGDGKADKSTVFLDKLVMPRSFAFVKGGILLQEPPKLWFCADKDGDLRCDERTQVGTMGVSGNPQHTANGLRRGIDNWLHCADWPHRYQWKDGKLIDEPTQHRGQFGVSFDETGRFISCYENSAMHMDLLPAEALMRHPNLAKLAQRGGRGGFGINVNVAKDAAECFPIRVTPAVTLGALELRDDGRLRTYTIVSGTCFYDGDQFPPEMHGNVFVPDSAGHLVGTLKLDGGTQPHATRFFPPEQELIASTDERFRPVNARVGPDGALYLADMYHGIIEHVIFIVPWLTKQIEQRKLYEGNDHGRIWRIVHERRAESEGRRVGMEKWSDGELVDALGHPNGWQRNTAQRLLVERGTPGVVTRLARNLSHLLGTEHTRLHSLWAIDGMNSLIGDILVTSASDPEPVVRAATARMLAKPVEDLEQTRAFELLKRLMVDSSEMVRLSAATSIGLVGQRAAIPSIVTHLAAYDDDLNRSAVVAGTHDMEADLIAELLPHEKWQDDTRHHRETLKLLSQLACMDGKAEAILAKVAETAIWQREALLDGFLASQAKVTLKAKPAFLDEMAVNRDIAARERLQRLRMALTWPGAESVMLSSRKQPLSEAAKQQVERGAVVYQSVCGLCHQPTGYGVPNVAPPLAESSWVTGEPERLIRIALHGLYGEIEVNGQKWNLAMPGQGMNPLLDDAKLADVLSYIRNAWGNEASVIETAQVADVREQTKDRKMPWTADTLLQVDVHGEIAIQPDADGTLLLPASAAKTYGQKLAYRPSLNVLAPWRIETDVAEWTIQIPADATYEVLVTLAADEASAGDSYVIEAETASLKATVKSTGGYESFAEQSAGTIKLKAGVQKLLMRPDGALKQELADVRALRLRKVRGR
ncbi:MAG: HEAT repeat domain-containing protein [Verrucomicrobiaceae bacterium]|nr:HEAT repeat domain-containing protein [Verrucomicrobiaceae bacterium]